MSQPAPPSHAARAGAWALLVALGTDLAFDLGRAALQVPALQRTGDWDAQRELLRWLDWLGDAWLPLQLVLVAVALVAFMRLRRGTSDSVARAMFLGAGVLWALRLGWPLAHFMFGAQGDYAAWGFATPWEQFFDRVRLAMTAAERVALGLLLAAIWRTRRAWGGGVGPAWTIAAAVFGLRSAFIVVASLGVFGAVAVDADGFLRRELMVWTLLTAEVATLGAALVALARAAPPDPAASRWRAAASGLDTYFRAVVTRVTVLVVGVVVTLSFSLGRTTPTTRAVLLLGTLGLQIPAVIAQIAGLTRYLDAPAPIARGALWTGLVAVGLGLVADSLMIAWFAAAAWDAPSAWGEYRVTQAMLRDVGAVGQVIAVVASVALLISLRRAAGSVGSAPLQRRATALVAALAAVAAVVSGLVFGLGDTPVRSPWIAVGVGLVALVIGLTVFISWLRLIEGVAEAMRRRAAEP